METYDLSFTTRRSNVEEKLRPYLESETITPAIKGALPVKHNVPKPVLTLLQECIAKIDNPEAIIQVRAHGGAIHGGVGTAQTWHSNFEIKIIPVD